MSFSFSWSYFLTFVVAMLFLYWIVFILAIWIRGYLNNVRVDFWFTRKLGIGGYVLGALAGAVTPFCSCTTVPIFVGMIESDIRLGYAVSFLIASPMLNPPALVLFYALFGPTLTLYYGIICFAVAILGGMLLSSNALKHYLIDILFITPDQPRFSLKAVNIQYVRFMSTFIVIILLAAAIATFLKGWTPSVEFVQAIGRFHLAAIPASVVLGGIIYADIALLIPIGDLFLAKGLDMGLVFAFMMAASGIGLPSIILLTRIFKKRLLFTYVLTVFALISLAGIVVSVLII